LVHLVRGTEGVLIRDAFPNPLLALRSGSGNAFLLARCLYEGIPQLLAEVMIGILLVAAFRQMVIRILDLYEAVIPLNVIALVFPTPVIEGFILI
jgi:hypothetical protein